MSNLLADQIRREAAGSDARLPPSASREAGSAANGESRAAGPATEILIMPLEGGGEVRFTAVHGRVDMQIRVGKGRSWLTTPVSAERAYQAARRLVTIAHTAAEQRQAKGA